MSTQAWNILGLLCATAGVLLLFRYGMPYRVRRGGESLLTLNQRDLDDLKQERLYDGLGWVGLVLRVEHSKNFSEMAPLSELILSTLRTARSLAQVNGLNDARTDQPITVTLL